MTEYKYALLRHQPSLQANEMENFAVLVEGRLHNRGILFAVGRSVAPQVTVSQISASIGDKMMPDILDSLVREAVREKKPTEDILDWISERMTWNFSATTPKTILDADPIYAVAFKLFSQHVAGADQLLNLIEKSTEKMVRPPDASVRLGETFQSAFQVPEPALAMT